MTTDPSIIQAEKRTGTPWWLWLVLPSLVCCGGVGAIGFVGYDSGDLTEPSIETSSPSSLLPQPPLPQPPPVRQGSREKAILGGSIEDFDARLGAPVPPNLRPQIAHYVSCTPNSPRWSVHFDSRGAHMISVTYCDGEPVPALSGMLAEARTFMPADAKPTQTTTNRSGDRVHVFDSKTAAQQRPAPSRDCTGATAPPGRVSVALYPPGSPTGEPGWGLTYGACA